MQVERVYGKDNKTILCNVPPMLPGNLFDQPLELTVMPGITRRFGDFSVASFLARFLAGNRSLKEAREISRKRLALVASGVGYLDAEAYALNHQVQCYIKAKQTLVNTPEHTIESLLGLNGMVTLENQHAGAIRKKQNWVGGKTVFTARYVCPPPELVDGLMDNWLAFINASNISPNTPYSPETKAIIGHCQLASIHPFFEGNGRTSRLFIDGLLEKTYGDRVPLLAYRLSPSCPPRAYIEAQECLNVGDPKGLAHPFWSDALAWGEQLQKQIIDILSQTRKKIYGKVGLAMLSPASVTLLNHLWSQPIVCQQGLLRLFDMNPSKVHVAINELVKLGILETRKLRAPANAVIYDCPMIFAAYTAMDDLVFS